MKIRTLLFAGFGFLGLASIAMVLLLLINSFRTQSISDRITNVYIPSVSYLNDLHNLMAESKMLIKSWVFIDSKPQTPDKERLRQIHSREFHRITERLEFLSSDWSNEDRLHFGQIETTIRDTLFERHSYVMNLLSSFDDYNRSSVMFEAISMVEEDNDEIMRITNLVLAQIGNLVISQERRVLEAKQEMKHLQNMHHLYILLAGGFLIFCIFFIAILFVRQILFPVNMLNRAVQEVKEGDPDIQILLDTNNELQSIAEGINRLSKQKASEESGA